MAELTGYAGVFHGDTANVDTTPRQTLGTRAHDTLGREWIYLKGVVNTVEGSWVTFDEGQTALLAANAIGPVAVSGGEIVADRYGWYCIHSGATTVPVRLAANSADNASLGRETSDGVAGDGRAAGDQILGAVARSSTSGSAALGAAQIYYPSVNDITGA